VTTHYDTMWDKEGFKLGYPKIKSVFHRLWKLYILWWRIYFEQTPYQTKNLFRKKQYIKFFWI